MAGKTTPNNQKPVTQSDINILLESKNYTNPTFIGYHLGVSPVELGKLKKAGKKASVTNVEPALAVNYHLLKAMNVSGKYPTFSNVVEVLQKHTELSTLEIGLLFGGDATAGYRWKDPKKPPSDIKKRLFKYFIDGYNEARGKKKFITDFVTTVLEEAEARGIEDLFETKTWGP